MSEEQARLLLDGAAEAQAAAGTKRKVQPPCPAVADNTPLVRESLPTQPFPRLMCTPLLVKVSRS